MSCPIPLQDRWRDLGAAWLTAGVCLGLAGCAGTSSMHAEEVDSPRCQSLNRPIAPYTRHAALRVVVGPGGKPVQAVMTHSSGDLPVDTWLMCLFLARPWDAPSKRDMARGFIVTVPVPLRAGVPAPSPQCPRDPSCPGTPTP